MAAICKHLGCVTEATFGLYGTTRVEFCSDHKGAGMVILWTPMCAYDGCSKKPAYGNEGSRKPELCREHKKAGMVDVVDVICKHLDCSKYPSFGTEGTGKVEFCSKHKEVGMVCVVNKPCAHEGCYEGPSFGNESTRKREFCFEHKSAGMVSSKKRCVREGCVKIASFGVDGSSKKGLLCARHFDEGHQAGASALEEAKSGEEAKEMEVVKAEHFPQQLQKASGSLDDDPSNWKRVLALETETCDPSREAQQASGSLDDGPSNWKRVLALETETRDPSREAQQVPALVRESSQTLSLADSMPFASQDSIDQSPVPARQNLGRGEDATSRAPRRFIQSGCGSDSVRDPPSYPGVAAANPARAIPTQGIARTNARELGMTGWTGIVGPGDGALGCGRGGERAEAGDGDGLIASRCASPGRDVSTISSQQHRRFRAPSFFAVENKRKIASLERENKEATAEANILQDKVKQLKKQVADAAARKAHAVAEATGKVEGKYTEIIQALRDEYGAASRSLKDSKGALEVVCEERKVIRQQVTKLLAEVALACADTKAKGDSQQRMEALRAELTEALMGWENAKDDLKEMRQEHDALHKEIAFAADIASKVAKVLKPLEDRFKSANGGPGTTMQAQTRATVDAIAPGPVFPARVRPSVMAGLATIASPVALVAGVPAAQSLKGAPASELPTPAEAAPPIIAVDGVVENADVKFNMVLPFLGMRRRRTRSSLPWDA